MLLNTHKKGHQPSIVFSEFGSQTKLWSCDIFHSFRCSSVAPFII